MEDLCLTGGKKRVAAVYHDFGIQYLSPAKTIAMSGTLPTTGPRYGELLVVKP